MGGGSQVCTWAETVVRVGKGTKARSHLKIIGSGMGGAEFMCYVCKNLKKGNGPMDGWLDRPSHRDARTRVKTGLPPYHHQ